MNFDGMTAEQAAEAIMQQHYQMGSTEERIAAACQHFYERGKADMRPKYGPVDPGKEVAAMTPSDAFYKGWLAAEDARNNGWTDDPIDPQADVRAFMAAFNQPMPSKPQWPDQETMDLRVRLVAEEFCEWLRDSGYERNVWIAHYEETLPLNGGLREIFSWAHDPDTADTIGERSMPKSADALIDMLYVTIGSLLAMGIDMWPLWAEVQRANMAKSVDSVKAADDRKIRGLSRAEKVTKPEGWKPPDIAGLLKNQGWEGEETR